MRMSTWKVARRGQPCPGHTAGHAEILCAGGARRSFGRRPSLTGASVIPRDERRSANGFTLLELLVVLVIFLVLTGTVVLGFTGADEEQELRGMAERIGARIELARQYSLQRNREWGVFVESDSYRFAELDRAQGQWIDQAYRPFLADGPSPRIAFHVEIEGFDREQFGVDEEDLPNIILFSSGEVTPFKWSLDPAWDAPPWVVSSDGLAEARVERDGRRR